MATAFQWHPGNHCINPQWALPVPLLPDELLSSWLVRAAFAQGCDPLVLTGWLWPGWRIWTGDPDRGLSPERNNVLEKVSGIPACAFQRTFLEDIAKRVARYYRKKRAWPWILVLGTQNRNRKSGLLYCPACLREDPTTYYKISWRLGWHTVCEKHGIRLLDACPRCHAPLEPHRLSMGDSMSQCARCGYALEKAAVSRGSTHALEFQRMGNSVASSGTGSFGNMRISSYEWFRLARSFINLARKVSVKHTGAMADMFSLLGIDLASLTPPATGLPWEFLSVKERESFGSVVGILLHTGPQTFLEIARKCGVTSKTITEVQPPHILRELAKHLSQPSRAKRKNPLKGRAPLSRRSVERKFARLQRKVKGK